MEEYHKSVLLSEAINALSVKKGKKYIDATLGGGGHAGKIIEIGGIVLGIDADDEALDFVRNNFKFQISNLKLRLAKGNFRDIDLIAKKEDFEKVNGIIFDLGVSSHQLDQAGRGFSFMQDGPLDMRMDRSLSVSAEGLINILTKGELNEIFIKLGEEYRASAISESIIRARRISPIKTTQELVEIVKGAIKGHKPNINPATKVFQALRIAVNDELNSIREALPKALELLEVNGRLAVISFHSLEDRIVKHQFKDWEKQEVGRSVFKKPLIPGSLELENNRRARSAKLRVFEKNN